MLLSGSWLHFHAGAHEVVHIAVAVAEVLTGVRGNPGKFVPGKAYHRFVNTALDQSASQCHTIDVAVLSIDEFAKVLVATQLLEQCNDACLGSLLGLANG